MNDSSFSEFDSLSSNQTAHTLTRLRELILSGDLQPGTRITELAMVERLGVSRTPIRAALQRLELEGLLDPLPGGGYKLRHFSEADVEDAIEVRATLEGLAARLAAERGVSNALLTRAREVLMCIDAILSEPLLTEQAFASYMVRNEELHSLLGEMCGSDVVKRQLERATNQPFAAPGTFLYVQAMMPQARMELIKGQDQHQSLFDAIARREGSRAEAIAREHARRGRRALIHAIHQRSTDLVPGGALIKRRSVAA